MKRLHLFEFEDFPWFPAVIRDSATDFLRFMIETLRFYDPAVLYINKVLKLTGKTSILDLCSGGGGGMVDVFDQLIKEGQTKIEFTLSDKYPNLPAFKDVNRVTNGGIKYINRSVDALDVAADIRSLRTMFSAFHHFNPDQAKQVLKSAVDSGSPVAFFDGAGNKFIIALAIALGHPFIFFFATPFIKPFKFSRLFFTYIIPIIPITTIWDGIASAFRFYNTREIDELTTEFKSYHWETGTTKGKMLIRMRYLIGYPISKKK
jgi:hypothetical protein